MAYTTATYQNDVDTLRGKLKGTLLLPGDSKYNSASQPWNRFAEQHPAFVIVAGSSKDIQIAVKFANDNGLGVGVMCTGHGIGMRCNDGVLINTSQLRGVTVDPDLKQATVEAGALWKDVIDPAYTHGLATLAGSAPHVGVVGYTVGGGFGYLGRKYGLSSDSVVAAELVMADGTLAKVSAEKNKELFWAVNGGGGNFGIITSLTVRVYPLKTVYGGAVFYPINIGREALTAFDEWARQIPDEITAGFSFVNFPAVPMIPEMFRGKSVVAIKGCYCGENLKYGEQLFAPLRALSKPIADSFATMTVDEMGKISNDPVDPTGNLSFNGLIKDLSPKAIEAFVKAAGAGSGSSLISVEIRTLGGALGQNNGSLALLGSNNAKYSVNAIGSAVDASAAANSERGISRLSEFVSPHLTGELVLNFLEVDPAEQHVRAAYTADDWQKLTTLKKKYDPKNTFRFNRNIPPQ